MSTANVLTLLILLASIAAMAWGMYQALANKIDDQTKANDGKIKRVFERQDEELEKVNDRLDKEYMRIDAHNLSIQHMKEIMEIKQNATIQLFTSQLADLTQRVRELIDRQNKKEGNGLSRQD